MTATGILQMDSEIHSTKARLFSVATSLARTAALVTSSARSHGLVPRIQDPPITFMVARERLANGNKRPLAATHRASSLSLNSVRGSM